MNLHVDNSDHRTIHGVSYFEIRGDRVYVEYDDGAGEELEATTVYGGDSE